MTIAPDGNYDEFRGGIEEVEPPDSEVLPFPEVLRHGQGGPEWDVRISNEDDDVSAATDLDNRDMVVSGDEADWPIRSHELLHAQWTPNSTQRKSLRVRAVPEKADGWEQLAEEMRVMAIHKRLDIEVPFAAPGRYEMANTPSAIKIALARIGSVHVKEIIRDLKHADKANRRIAAEDKPFFDLKQVVSAVKFCQAAYDDLPNMENSDDWLPTSKSKEGYRWSMRLAKKLRMRHPKIKIPPFMACQEAFGKSRKRRNSAQKTWESRFGLDGVRSSQKPPDVVHGLPAKTKRVGGAPWGEMDIAVVPMSQKVTEAYDYRKRAEEEGLIVTRPDRWAVDRRVFGITRKTRKPGATVLIDVSGSMCWTIKELEEVLTTVPAATIAMYSGSGSYGTLAIIAREGRRCDKEAIPSMPYQNVIDGPALEWLAKQSAPRIWVSDGWATGRDDLFGPWHQRESRRLCIKARAARAQDLDAAIRLLRKGYKYFPASYCPPVAVV